MRITTISLALVLIFSCSAQAQDSKQTAYLGLKLGSERLTQSDINVDLECDVDLDSPPIEHLSPPQQIKVLRRLAIVHLVSKEAYKAGIQNEPMVKAQLEKMNKDIAAHAPPETGTEVLKAHQDAFDRFAITDHFLYEKFPKITATYKEEDLRKAKKEYFDSLLKANEVKILDAEGHAIDLPPESQQ